MMDSREPSYVEQVERLYGSVVGRRLVFTDEEVATVRMWERRGIPLEVVERGFRSALKVAGVAQAGEGQDQGGDWVLRRALVPPRLAPLVRFVEKAFLDHCESVTAGRILGRRRRGRGRGVKLDVSRALKDAALAYLDQVCGEMLDDRARDVVADAKKRIEDWPGGKGTADLLARTDSWLVEELYRLIAPHQRDATEVQKRKAVGEAFGYSSLVERAIKGIQRKA